MSLSSRRNGGDVVVETLSRLGCTTIFGIPGQNALGLFDAISRSSLRFISSRVENNSAFSADGYARVTGEVGVLFLSSGPGALTALAGLHEAYATGVPIVVIASQVPRGGLGGVRTGMLHQLDDQASAAANVVKSSTLVRQASQIPNALAAAFALARTAPNGPVWIEIPEDVLLEPTRVPPVLSVVEAPRSVPPRAELIDAAAEMLSASQNTVILAGGGVRRSSGGTTALVRLAELLDAPVVSTVGGKGAIPFSHPLSAASWIEDRYTTELLEDAEVLLAVGTALGEITSNYFTFSPKGELIQVDAEPRVLESNHRALAIHSDAALTLNALGEKVTARHDAGGATKAAELRRRVENRLASQELSRELALMADLRSAVPANTQTFWDMTIAAYWAWSAWDPQDGGFHSAQGAGGLGFGFPAALAAAIATGQRTFAVSGDGGSMYSIAELATAHQHNAKVTWLIVDDGGYGILREYMIDAFGKATATELARPDFVALATSFGITAHEAELDTVGELVAGTFTMEGPVVIVLRTHLRMFAPTHDAGA